MTRRRFAAAMFAVAVVVVGLAPHNATAATAPPTINRVTAVTTYRVTMVGDSIPAMSFGFPAPGGVVNQGDTWRNLEYGRNAYTPGMGIPQGSGSTWAIAKLAIARTRPGGWVVIQDNSLGASDWEWSKLLTDIEALTPDSVCLLGVLPGFLDAAHGGRDDYAAIVARHASIMGQIFMRHPCRRFVGLGAYMLQHPTSFPDGQHPDATAQAWLRGQIVGSTR